MVKFEQFAHIYSSLSHDCFRLKVIGKSVQCKQQLPYKDACSAILGKAIGTPSTLIFALAHACISLPQVPVY